MLYLFFIILELLALFFTSKYLIQAMYGIFLRIFRKHSAAATCVFIIFFPGVIIHELAHLLVAEALFVRTGELEIAPRSEGNSLRMGSVQVAKTDIFRSMLIGVAPVIVGTIVLITVLIFFTGYISGSLFISRFNVLVTAAVAWAVFVVTNTMFSSKKDLEGALVFLAVILFLGSVICLMLVILKIDFVSPALDFLNTPFIADGAGNVSGLLLAPVVLNVFIFSLARIIVRKIY